MREKNNEIAFTAATSLGFVGLTKEFKMDADADKGQLQYVGMQDYF